MTHAQREVEALKKMKESGLQVSAASDNSFYVAEAFEWCGALEGSQGPALLLG